MGDTQAEMTLAGTTPASIRVRYWAALRAAAGRPEDLIETDEALTLDALLARVVGLHPDAERLVGVCSVLVGDRQVRSQDPGSVEVAPGAVVELLPPFAGG